MHGSVRFRQIARSKSCSGCCGRSRRRAPIFVRRKWCVSVASTHSGRLSTWSHVRPPCRGGRRRSIGQHRLRDGSVALGVGLAFGHAQADALAELARLAAAHGARAIRPAPDRALMLIGIAPANAAALTAGAEQLGFVVCAGDPRRRVAACPGAPACASGFIDARRLAAGLAPQLAGMHSGIAVHVSGCAKGCAHPAPAALTVVGTTLGCGIIRNGTARAMPQSHVAPGDLAAEVARAFASPARPSMAELAYLRDGTAIYERSFAIIRAEADLARFSAEEAEVAVRMIHACGLVEAARHIEFGRGLVAAARAALVQGAPILCNAEMVAHGITRARLPAKNEVVCALRDPCVPALAERLGITRSAAALDLWGDRLAGAVVAIGNAPTALFRLLEMLASGAPRPGGDAGSRAGSGCGRWWGGCRPSRASTAWPR